METERRACTLRYSPGTIVPLDSSQSSAFPQRPGIVVSVNTLTRLFARGPPRSTEQRTAAAHLAPPPCGATRMPPRAGHARGRLRHGPASEPTALPRRRAELGLLRAGGQCSPHPPPPTPLKAGVRARAVGCKYTASPAVQRALGPALAAARRGREGARALGRDHHASGMPRSAA